MILWTDRFIHLNMEYSLGLIPDLFTSSILFSAAGLALKFLFWLISFFFFAIYLLTVLNSSVLAHSLIILGTPLSLMLSLEVVCHLDCLCSDVTLWSLFLSLHMHRTEADVCVFPYCSPFYSFKTGFSLNLELTLLLDCLASKLWDPLPSALESGTYSAMAFYLCAAHFRALSSFPFCNSDKLPCQKARTIMKKEQAFKMTLKKSK